MKIYTRRNALVGWLVVRVARRKVRHRVDGLIGRGPDRRGLAVGASAVTGAALGAALLTRRARQGHVEAA
jgi:hypothetical protein